MNVNLLHFSLNDFLDYKLIEENNFTLKPQQFSPYDAFNFLFDILKSTLPLEQVIDC